jgi:hypothetical protein
MGASAQRASSFKRKTRMSTMLASSDSVPSNRSRAQRHAGLRRCAVCRHPERWRIELLKAGGASLDSLAAKFGLHRDAIARHWNRHVSAEMKAGYLAGPVQLQDLAATAAEQGSSVLDNLHAVRCVLMGQLSVMTEAGDARGAGYIGGQLVKVLETIARISGELGDLARSTTYITNNNIAVLAEHPAFARVQAALLRALAPHPAARADVVAALRNLDERAQTAPAAAANGQPKLIELEAAPVAG